MATDYLLYSRELQCSVTLIFLKSQRCQIAELKSKPLFFHKTVLLLLYETGLTLVFKTTYVEVTTHKTVSA